MLGIPKEKEIELIYLSEDKTIEYLFQNKVLYEYEKCPNCDKGKMIIYDSDKKTWRCTNYKCAKKISIYKDSFFANSRLGCNDLLRICYKWICGQRFSDILKQTRICRDTLSATIKFCRELVAANLNEETCVIRGPGVIVEVDESKFGKVKYGHGHKVEGAWVLGAVEKTPGKKIILRRVNDRSRKTLLKILGQYILPDSIVHTDLWKGYLAMDEELDVIHKTVNHSKNYKDPITGTHTNTIEGSWSGIKAKIAPRHRTKDLIDNHLCEFVWRRQNKNNLWLSFISCLVNTKY